MKVGLRLGLGMGMSASVGLRVRARGSLRMVLKDAERIGGGVGLRMSAASMNVRIRKFGKRTRLRRCL